MRDDWEIKTLEHSFMKDSSNLSINKLKDNEGDYPFYSAKGFVKNISFYHQEKSYLAIIKDGAGVGRVSLHPAKSSVVGTLQYLLPKEGFDLKFLYYYLLSVDFTKYFTGSTIPHIYFKDYKSEPFPVVALDEQKEIVEILDQAFESIEKAKANIEKNIENAKELFQSKLNQIFSQTGEGWEIKKISEVFDVKSSKRVHKADWKKEGIPFYRAREVVKLSKYGSVRNDLFISEELYSDFTKEKGAPTEGDIIISAVGTLGQCYLVKKSDKFYFKDASVLWFEKKHQVDSKYIEFAFKSNLVIKQVLNKSMGATVGTLTISRAKIIEIPIPPIEEQKEIVETLNIMDNHVKSLLSSYEEELKNLEELKKSILQKAFSGELTNKNKAA